MTRWAVGRQAASCCLVPTMPCAGARLRYPECGVGEERGHESHLPRRQRKARAVGGFILGEVGRGHGSLLHGEEGL